MLRGRIELIVPSGNTSIFPGPCGYPSLLLFQVTARQIQGKGRASFGSGQSSVGGGLDGRK